jgi:DNA-binding MarR family transcriptional regulator
MTRTVHGVDQRHNRPDPPLIGALLRRPFLAARDRIVQQLHAEGYADLQAAHLAVFQHPGPHGLSPGEIARRAGATKQAMSNLLSQLERSGYVRRSPDPDNGRQRIVELTERGRAATGIIRSAVTDLESEWRENLGETDYRRMRSLLERLNDVVNSSA